MIKIYSNKYDINYVSKNLQTYLLTNKFINFTAYDNDKYIIIRTNNENYIYYKNKLYLYNEIKIKLFFNNKIFWKDILSFEQNNKKIANKIRFIVLQFMKNNKKENIIGIGGEYYIYFCFLKYSKYIGYSNHNSIINDANFNCKFYINNYINNFIDYNKFILPYDLVSCDIIINLITVLDNILEEINKINFDKLVIISCKPIKKILFEKFILIKIKYFINFSNIISVSLWNKKS